MDQRRSFPYSAKGLTLRAMVADEVLTADVVEEVVLAAREMFDASVQPDHQVQLRHELAIVEREQARMADAIATGAGEIPAVVERLRAAEAKRRALKTELERAQRTRPAPAWRVIERQMRKGLSDWRARLQGDIREARAAF